MYHGAIPCIMPATHGEHGMHGTHAHVAYAAHASCFPIQFWLSTRSENVHGPNAHAVIHSHTDMRAIRSIVSVKDGKVCVRF